MAKRFGQPINTSAALILSTYTTLWGIWLILPFWDVFARADLYSWLSEVAPESVWGALAISVGVSMTYGIYKHTFKALTRGAFIGFVHWGAIATGYFIGDWQNTGGITSAMICAYCAFIYLNLMVNRRLIEEKGILH